MRGTGLINFVIVNATFAFLPGFGIYGLIFSNALQNLATGILQLPFGWVADRFGWAKSVIACFITKVMVTLAIIAAVLCVGSDMPPWWPWTFVVIHAVLEALSSSLYDGAYEAAFTEWYAIQLEHGLATPTAVSPPPLFIRSLRYSNWLRISIPISIVSVISLIQFCGGIGVHPGSYTATLTALLFILALRFVVLARIYTDLLPVLKKEEGRKVWQSTFNELQTIRAAINPIRKHFSAFVLFSVSCFQYWLSHAYVAGIAIQEIQKLSLPQPYDWLACVSITLLIYILDCLFWMVSGFRINKFNAATGIRNLALVLLTVCLLTSALYVAGVHPLFQSVGFAVCTLVGTICGGAVKRFFGSHIREWLESDYIASWMSVAQCLAFLSLALLGFLTVAIDNYLPNAALLLLVSVIVALALILYLRKVPTSF